MFVVIMFGERYIVYVVLYVLYVAFWLKRAEYRGGSSDWLDVVVIGWRWVGMSGQICSPPSPATILYCVHTLSQNSRTYHCAQFALLKSLFAKGHF